MLTGERYLKDGTFILFYLEPLQETDYKAEDFAKNGRGETHFDHLSAELTVRSGKLFGNAIIS